MSRSGGEVDAAPGEEVVAGVLRLLGSTDWLKVVLRGCHGGQGGSEMAGGKEIHGRSNSPAAASMWNSGAGVAWTGTSELGVGLGHGAELQWGFLTTVVQQSGEDTVAQGVLRGGARQRGG
jgi:hypothetical protein